MNGLEPAKIVPINEREAIIEDTKSCLDSKHRRLLFEKNEISKYRRHK